MDSITDMVMTYLRTVPLDEAVRAQMEDMLEEAVPTGHGDDREREIQGLKAFSSSYTSVLGQEAFDALVAWVWEAIGEPLQQAVKSSWRQVIRHQGVDLAQVALRCDTSRDMVLRWCSDARTKLPIEEVFVGILPLVLMAHVYHRIKEVSSWESDAWQAYHEQVRACIQGVTMAQMREDLPLGKRAIEAIRRGMTPQDRLYKDIFLLDMVLDVYEPKEEGPMQGDEPDTPQRAGALGEIIRRIEQMCALLSEEALEREDLMIMASREHIEIRVGDLYITRGERARARPDP